MFNGRYLTVGELIEKLKSVDASLPVVIEGCDCYGDAEDVVIKNYGTREAEEMKPITQYVLITRWN